MGKLILFRNSHGNVSVITPSPEWVNKYGIDGIARKDVPPTVSYEGTGYYEIDQDSGKQHEVMRRVECPTPYLIVDSSDVPEDRYARNEWEVDFNAPDGFGIGSEAWLKEKGLL